MSYLIQILKLLVQKFKIYELRLLIYEWKIHQENTTHEIVVTRRDQLERRCFTLLDYRNTQDCAVMLQGGGTSLTNYLWLTPAFREHLNQQTDLQTDKQLLMELTLVSKQVDMICH